MLTVPEKHKPNSRLIEINNLKMIDKIVNVKSQFNFRKDTVEYNIRQSNRMSVGAK
jgi:hypothetical protein